MPRKDLPESRLIVYQAFHPKMVKYKGTKIEDPFDFNRYFDYESEIERTLKQFMHLSDLSGGIKGFLQKHSEENFYLENLPLISKNYAVPSVAEHMKGYGQVAGAELALPLSQLQYEKLEKSLAGIENLNLERVKTRWQFL